MLAPSGLEPLSRPSDIPACSGRRKYVPCSIKLAQARIPEAEFELLRRQARSERTTMPEWVRRANREKLPPDEVDPSDPIFSAFPLVRGKGPRVDVSTRHDDYLYGPSE